MDNFTPVGNWADDEPLDSPPQESSPKKENQRREKRHSSIERYRPSPGRGGGGGYDEQAAPSPASNGSFNGHSGGGHQRGGGGGHHRGGDHQLRRPLHSVSSDRDGDHEANEKQLPSNDLRNKLKNRTNGGGGLESGLQKLTLGGNGGGSNLDLRSRLNARSRTPELPPQGHEVDGELQREEQRQQRRSRGGGGQNRQNHKRVQGPGAGGTVAERNNRGHFLDKANREPRKNGPTQANQSNGGLPRPKRNTENFNPSYEPPQMRILFAPGGLKSYLDYRSYTTRDVLVVNDLFCEHDDLSIYNRLQNEIKNSGVDSENLWKSWHGDSHWIADDKLRWKEACPTFHMVLNRLADYFTMDIKATRLNWYRDSTEWKPFHHDAAAVKPDKAKTQNFTVAVSFGMERDAAFEHAQTKTVISMPQPNGTVYTFGKDVNILWRHGILQMPPDKYKDEGRVSIIAWGWIPMEEVPVS